MKKNVLLKSLLKPLVFVLAILCSAHLNAQQNIGAHPNIDAGFESQSTGNLPSQSSSAPNTSATYWAYTTSGNGQIRTISASGGYGGPKYLSVGKVNPTSNTSTTAVSNLVTTNTFAPATKYIVQFHYKINTGAIDTANSYVFLSGDNTSASRATGNLTGLTTNTTWTKFTRVITTGANQTTLGTVGIVAKMVGTASGTNSGVIDVDNMVAYPADDQNNPVADVAAPAAPSGFTAAGNPAAVLLNWTAPASGTDNGGYMVVRYTADPSAEADPVQNAVYKATATNLVGTTGTVVYVGTDNFFSDGSGVIGTNYWYRVYTVDKAFNYSTPVTAGPVAATSKVNFYYDGSGATDVLTNWWTNANGTGTNPPNFSNPGQVFHIITNANLVANLAITGTGSSLILGDVNAVPGLTVDFNSTSLPGIDTIYQSSDGNPMVLNFNTAVVPSINQLYDIFTQVHYRASGTPINVGTTKDYDKIFIENNADVTFTGGSSTVPPVKTNYFYVEAGSSATAGTLSSRWIQIKTGGQAIVNGRFVTPKLAGLSSNGTGGVPASTGGALQFDDAGADVVLGPNSTIEYSSTSTTTTQSIMSRSDYANVVISGSGVSKTITGAVGISGSLTMNTTGSTGLILQGGALTLNQSLVLTAGKINTDATNILILGANATVSGGNNTSYVSGPVKRNTAGTSGYLMPTGKAGLYRPVTINPAAATASVYQAEFFNNVYSVTAVNAPLTGIDTTYWDVAKLSGANASVSLTLDGGTAIPNATPADELVVAHFDGTAWNSVSAVAINPGSAITGTATSTVLSSFSPFTFGIKPTSTVPVTLVSFKGNLKNNKAQLNWSVVEERNIAAYVVEESKDGRSFNAIGNVQPKNIATGFSYSFNGTDLVVGQMYYRLKMASIDGKVQYSNIVAIKNTAASLFALQNNPVMNHMIRFNTGASSLGNCQLSIHDAAGKFVYIQPLTIDAAHANHAIAIDPSIAPGVYFMTLQGGGIAQHVQVVID